MENDTSVKTRIQYQFNLHLYVEQELNLSQAIKMYNKFYTLKIVEFKKKASRYYFKVDALFPKELSTGRIEEFRQDTIFRLGYLLKN